MNTSRVCAALAVALAIATPSLAQDPPNAVERERTLMAAEFREDPAAIFSLGNNINYMALLARRSGSLVRLLQQYQAERTDQQIGATSSASGSTTLVSKGTVPKILALAVENGAVSRNQSGTTVTFRSSLGGSIRALAGKGFFELTPGDDPALALLNRLSASVSFDTSRGANETATSGTTPAPATSTTFTGDRSQLSQWTARLQLVNHRDPQSSQALMKWQTRVLAKQKAGSQATMRLYNALEADPAVKAWAAKTSGAVQAARAAAAGKAPDAFDADVIEALKTADAAFPAQLTKESTLALDDYEKSEAAFFEERHSVLQEVAAGALVTVEYTNDRPVLAPNTSNVRLVGAIGGSVDLTGNASLTLFDQIPAGVSQRVRDFQLAAQLDVKVGSISSTGPFLLSFSGKYIHQFENSFDDAGTMMPETKGTTAIGQLKLTIPAGKDTGARIPLSITIANRTDLIQESVVRANLGITYDLDSLFSKFKP